MIAPACQHTETKRFGHDRNGNQRFRCILCGKTWLEPRVKPIGDMRIDHDTAVKCSGNAPGGRKPPQYRRLTGLAHATYCGSWSLPAPAPNTTG